LTARSPQAKRTRSLDRRWRKLNAIVRIAIEAGMKLDQSLEPFHAGIESCDVCFTNSMPGVWSSGESQLFFGKPRFTADVDAMFLLLIQDIPKSIELAKVEKISPRIQIA